MLINVVLAGESINQCHKKLILLNWNVYNNLYPKINIFTKIKIRYLMHLLN
jgi:hypothetical protein